MLSPSMSAAEFSQWMESNAYDDESLALDLEVHRLTVVKWRTGRHAVTRVIVLALERLASDKRAANKRRREIEHARAAVAARREARAAGRSHRAAVPA